jgi:hypothetical protein
VAIRNTSRLDAEFQMWDEEINIDHSVRPQKVVARQLSDSPGGFNRLLNFRPGFEAAAFERQRAYRIPSRLDQVEMRH